MTSSEKPRRVEIKDGDQTVAAAEVAEHGEGTVRTSLLPSSGHTPPGSRASLVDAVMDQPEVKSGSRLEATVPLGDAESLERLRERTEDAVTRPAGSTALVDADLPDADDTTPGREPSGEGPGSLASSLITRLEEVPCPSGTNRASGGLVRLGQSGRGGCSSPRAG